MKRNWRLITIVCLLNTIGSGLVLADGWNVATSDAGGYGSPASDLPEYDPVLPSATPMFECWVSKVFQDRTGNCTATNRVYSCTSGNGFSIITTNCSSNTYTF